jgi:hypothetical protein
MAHEIGKGQSIQARRRAFELLSKTDAEGHEVNNLKRERFLAVLKNEYGYTNDKAVDELERLLKQIYTINKSLGIRRSRLKYNQSHTE